MVVYSPIGVRMVIKVFVITGSSHTSMAQALLVSVLMTLISHVTSRLEQRISLIDPTFLSKLIPEDEKVRFSCFSVCNE